MIQFNRTLIFVFIFLLTGSFTLPQYNAGYTIKQLKMKDGLSQSSILAILQDSRGFMWFATGSGLNKYDGYSFKVYLNNPSDSFSISDNGITTLFEDREGYIWVGTTGGFVNRFDRRTETFRRFNISKSFQPAEKMEDNYYEYPLLYSRNSDNSITSISEDKDGRIWVGTWGRGLFILNKQTNEITNFCNDQNDSHSLSFNRVTKILSDNNKNMWIATFGGGLNEATFNSTPTGPNIKLLFQHYKNLSSNKSSLSDNKVTTLFEDKSGSLWIGTYYGGLNKLESDEQKKAAESAKFTCFTTQLKNQNSLSDNSVMAITEDDSGFLWIGTFGGGLNRFNPQDKTFLRFMHNNLDENTIGDNDVISLYKDDSGIIWVGTHLGEGISRLERKNAKFDVIKSNPSSSSSLNDDVVWSILKDKEDILWIGTYRGGLNRYDEKSKMFTFYKSNPVNINSISNNHIRSIAEDKFGNLWVGTYAGGLNKFNKRSGKITRYVNSLSDSSSISGNQIQKLFIDSNSVMWIAVFGGGLNVLDLKNQSHLNHFL